jgi:hypothetical protein
MDTSEPSWLMSVIFRAVTILFSAAIRRSSFWLPDLLHDALNGGQAQAEATKAAQWAGTARAKANERPRLSWPQVDLMRVQFDTCGRC